MVGVILGTGVFGGYCIGGSLQVGSDGIAGEWGHLAIPATVRERYELPLHRCGCGLSKIGELYGLLPPALSKHLFGGVQPPSIVPAKFGDASGARGAAIFAAQRCG